MARVLRVESTPNPAARKWVLSSRFWEGSRSFMTPEDASGDELGAALMGIEGVRCVLLCSDWVTVNVAAAGSWGRVKKAVDAAIGDWLDAGDTPA